MSEGTGNHVILVVVGALLAGMLALVLCYFRRVRQRYFRRLRLNGAPGSLDKTSPSIASSSTTFPQFGSVNLAAENAMWSEKGGTSVPLFDGTVPLRTSKRAVDEADRSLRSLTVNEVDVAKIAALGGFAHTSDGGAVVLVGPDELPVAAKDLSEDTKERLVSAATSVLLARMASEAVDESETLRRSGSDPAAWMDAERGRRESEVKKAAMAWFTETILSRVPSGDGDWSPGQSPGPSPVPSPVKHDESTAFDEKLAV